MLLIKPGRISWGESAGAISVALQMVTNKGQQGNLFRGAFMNSGSPIPVGPIDSAKSQAVFDFVSDTVGCRDEDKTLACMRLVPYSALKAAIDLTPGFVSCKISLSVD
jgi:acetylcholinesterase